MRKRSTVILPFPTQKLNVACVHSITHSLTHPPTHSVTHSLTHSLTNSPIHSPTHPLSHSLTHSLIHPLTHTLTHQLTHSPTHTFTHQLTHSPTHSFACVSHSDVDECDLQNVSVCDENAECTNAVGGFNCSCSTGYSGDGLTCGNVVIVIE